METRRGLFAVLGGLQKFIMPLGARLFIAVLFLSMSSQKCLAQTGK